MERSEGVTTTEIVGTLPGAVIEKDHSLDAKASRATEALAKHRWHWTLDESNPDRVSFRAYAKAVGRSNQNIRRQVLGYATYIEGGTAAVAPLGELIERAGMGAETEAATEAIAERYAITFKQARQGRSSEVKATRDLARTRAEQHGTTFEEELPRAVKFSTEPPSVSTPLDSLAPALRWMRVDVELAKAERYLRAAEQEVQAIGWDDDERADLLDKLNKRIEMRAQRIRDRLEGRAVLDWENELDSILEGAE